MRIDTEKLNAMISRKDALHTHTIKLRHEWEEARSNLARTQTRANQERNRQRTASYSHEQKIRIANAEKDVEASRERFDEAKRAWQQYAESIAGLVEWAESNSKRPGYRDVSPTVMGAS